MIWGLVGWDAAVVGEDAAVVGWDAVVVGASGRSADAGLTPTPLRVVVVVVGGVSEVVGA
jgi:hypothetical protein